mgnify:CR=1 FL=1
MLQVSDKKARDWYEKEVLEQTWSTRTLQRNIDTQYYYRLLKSQVKETVIKEMEENNKENYMKIATLCCKIWRGGNRKWKLLNMRML